ncbi:MAG: ABC transporter permease [Chloroflexi bacterium]|nr:ABC transporter permease [Chloroflexota bacterium]
MTWKWLLRRLGIAFLVFIVALILNFIIPRLMAGDAKTLIESSKLEYDTQQALIKQFGLDKSLLIQFFEYMKNSFQGNFGLSFTRSGIPVLNIIETALPWSLYLLITATVIQVIIAYFLGVLAAWRAGSKRDSIIQAVSLGLWATPMFWLAMIILWVFAYKLDWFPLGNSITAGSVYNNPFQWIGDVIYHSTLPIFCIVINSFGGYQLLMRNTMVTTIRENYITTAEAKGLTENKVKYKHAARNAMLPLVTSVGIRFALSVGGSVFVEKIFSYQGVGYKIFQAVQQRDYPVIQGCFFILAVSVIVVNLIVDLIYQRLDPRISY